MSTVIGKLTRPRARTALFAAVLVGLAPAAAHAQTLSTGMKVRLVLRGDTVPVNGRLSSITPGEWTLVTANAEPRTYARASVARVEVWRPRRHAALGLFIGAAIGTAVGFATRPDPPPPRDPEACTPERGDILPFDVMLSLFCSIATAGADAAVENDRRFRPVVGALLGAAVGALAGHTFDTGEWVPAVVPRVSPGAAGVDLNWRLRTGG